MNDEYMICTVCSIYYYAALNLYFEHFSSKICCRLKDLLGSGDEVRLPSAVRFHYIVRFYFGISFLSMKCLRITAEESHRKCDLSERFFEFL